MERYQQNFHALGSDVILTIITDKNGLYVEWLFKKLSNHIVDFEKKFSRFLPDSELTKLNLNTGTRMPISPEFYALLETANNLAEETGGLFNPFILPALQQAGYLGSWPKPDSGLAATDFSARKAVGIHRLALGRLWARIPRGSAIDFGGIGKGYLLDELAASLTAEDLTDYWLSIGGDIICSGYDTTGHAWQVAVQSAVEPTKSVETITNTNGQKLAIATSGITKRAGLKNGTTWHHIIDPRTGSPAKSDILTATVTASKAVVADVYAKCIVIAGSESAEKYKQIEVIQSYVLQLKDNKTVIEAGKA